MASVEIEDLRKSFGSVETIRGVSITIPDGAFVALVGPSGCGKSTILRLIAGLDDITAGQISVGGRVINEVEPKNRDIAMVFQNYALYPHMTVTQNMGFSLRLLKRSKSEINEAVKQVAQILGLDDYLERYPRQLSGGQRQRVAMGRAIVRQPQVFLFDEPLSNLDAKLRVQMRAELKSLHNRLGTTTIYVTHDQIEAMTMADIVVLMNEGQVVQAGSPLELYDRPVNMFAAGFIGSPAMNFLPAELQQGSTRAEIGDGQTLELPRAQPARGQGTLGIRPEHLTLAAKGEGLAIEVDNVEPTGSETLIQGHSKGSTVSVLLRERFKVRVGERVWLTALPAHIHLFNKDTGASISLDG